MAIPPNLGSRQVYDPENVTPLNMLRDPEEPYRSPSVCSGESSGNDGDDVYCSEEEESPRSDYSVESVFRETIDGRF